DTAAAAQRFAFHPAQERLGLPLIRDFEGCGHVLLQPLDQISKESGPLPFVSVLGIPRRCRCEIYRCGIAAEDRPECVIRAREVESEEYFVLSFLILVSWWIEGLKEI